MVGGADWASNWGAGEAPRVCVSEVMLRRVARAGDGVRAAGRAGEGGVGTTGWCAATLTTNTRYRIDKKNSVDVRDLFSEPLLALFFVPWGGSGAENEKNHDSKIPHAF